MKTSRIGSIRYARCHKPYTDWILGSEFYPTKYRYSWLFSFKEWCNSQENNGFYCDSALNSFNLHNKPPVYTQLHLMHLNKWLKTSQQSNRKWIYNVCSLENFTQLKRNFTWVIIVHPWQVPCLDRIRRRKNPTQDCTRLFRVHLRGFRGCKFLPKMV